jgi:hypothetical protein
MKKINIYLFIAIVAIALTSASCSKDNKNIKGSGPVVEQSFNLPPIHGTVLSIDANVFITPGDSQTVRITGQQNIIDNIEKFVQSDGIWRIGYYHSVRNHAGVSIYITTPHFDYATISGSGNTETTNFFSDSTNVYLSISGSGNIIMRNHAQLIECEISGSGNISLYGTADSQYINISGSGNVAAFGMDVYDSWVKISGSGSSQVNVEHFLDVNISGSGSVFYKGNPQMNVNISGSGAVINSN